MADEPETYAFSADISQLMSLIINAFYSNKEIFLRELISNASDAMDKIRHLGQEDAKHMESNPDLYCRVIPDRASGTITIEDAGIGLTRDDMINNLGTIARSGTKAFMEKMTADAAGDDLTMIGQFGVGFYSSYLVSDRVRVVSKHNDDEQHIWESTAGGTFTVQKDEEFNHGVLKRGTKVILFLKEDCLEFCQDDRCKDLIMTHSIFVGYPISLWTEDKVEENEGEEQKQKTYHWDLINKNKPLWLRATEEVSHQDYAELFKWLANDFEDHLNVRHVKPYGQVDVKALLFCPRKCPPDMFEFGQIKRRSSLKLYVRRVFIMECKDILPQWMGFLYGILDSDDMPLNISREKLQQNSILKYIQNHLTKKCFEMFEEISQNEADNKLFHSAFSQCLKLGVYQDHTYRAQIAPLLRYHTSKSGDKLASLSDYVSRMKPNQNHILYITGRSLKDAARSPFIERLKKDDYEVLYMTDSFDEFAVNALKKYENKEFMSCMSQEMMKALYGSADDATKEMEPARLQLQAGLTNRVSKVVFVASPPAFLGCVEPGADGKLFLELNPSHTLMVQVIKLKKIESSLAQLICDIALFLLKDGRGPAQRTLATRVQEIMDALGAGEKGAAEEDIPPARVDKFQASADSGSVKRPRKDAEGNAWLCIGNTVRVMKDGKIRRAVISFVDEDDQTADVMYNGSNEEEEAVPFKKLQQLQDFETSLGEGGLAARFKEDTFATAAKVKEEGNTLFKLKDCGAAEEWYTAMIDAMRTEALNVGQAVLVNREETNGKGARRTLQATKINSLLSADSCELACGGTSPLSAVIPVHSNHIVLQVSAYMNRARCRQSLERYREAANDLTTVLGLWDAADACQVEADAELKEARTKGLCTAQYLRAQTRLNRGYAQEAAADIKEAVGRSPPAAIKKQLDTLATEVKSKLEEQRKETAPVTRELAKICMQIES